MNERGNLNQELAWDESLEMQDEKQRKEGEDVTLFGYCSTCNTQETSISLETYIIIIVFYASGFPTKDKTSEMTVRNVFSRLTYI